MIRNTITIIFTLFISIVANAQFNFELWTTNSKTGVPGETLIILGDLVNLSGEDMEIQITRIEENVPQGWETAMCTDVCQVPSISQVNYTLVWGEYQTYSTYFYTSPESEGTGTVTVTMVNLADTTNSFTQQYFATTEFAVSTDDPRSLAKQARLYPTIIDHTGWLEVPAGLITKTKSLKFLIFDTSGQLVSTTDVVNPLTEISRSTIPPGTYFYGLQSTDGLLGSGKMMFH